MLWVFQMISPVFRCHHMSGSSKRDRTVRTASTRSRPASIVGKEKTRLLRETGDGLPVESDGMRTELGHCLFRVLRFCHEIRFGDPDEAMQIRPGDVEAASRQRLVSVVLIHGGDC